MITDDAPYSRTSRVRLLRLGGFLHADTRRRDNLDPPAAARKGICYPADMRSFDALTARAVMVDHAHWHCCVRHSTGRSNKECGLDEPRYSSCASARM